MRRGKSNCLAHALLALCAVLILGAMAALTRGVVDTQRERARMEAKADEQERIRLALWRVDSAAAAWIADEAQRPLPDLVLKEAPKAEVKLRFDAREDGEFIADNPDKTGTLREALGLPPEQKAFSALCAGMPEIPSSWSVVPPPKSEEPLKQEEVQTTRQSNEYQKLANTKEFAGRSRAVRGAVDKGQEFFNSTTNRAVNLSNGTSLPEDGSVVPNAAGSSIGGWTLLRGGLPRPAQFGSELFLLRHLQWTKSNGSTMRSIQGSWLDEGAFKAMLLREVADLFPTARLIPALPSDAGDGLALASFPWKISPGNGEAATEPLPRGIQLTLAAGWGAAVLAILAAWLLVIGLMRLSERRASFVSAVTHELRTPLTTFQLYSGMLESGAIKEEKRGEYFLTLRREAERLSHLVENVLAFSRIERGSARASSGRHVLGEMVAPMLERFQGRLSEANLKLVADIDDPAWNATVQADPAAVEHVLFNLIDNASKYAAGSEPNEVALEVEPHGQGVKVCVRDHGNGVARSDRKRIFRAFHKSAAAAAESRPGVGLGLSLSRRLAKAGGGDLRLENSERGACFTLTLPGA
ncbi:sensor histidine kinase [Luteolibacter luteus]|uniref:histidine kinase n=1 Tax=Luteolibacter luteus TaxID=2728835 RepID=A0A858RKS5_9BACT|nr:HAMP domain-containing sensor histidine kinase [Luteolibacter luteus]QJE97201.1 HAMP domain-containing histidine kinase [Luteolibacter luteus]